MDSNTFMNGDGPVEPGREYDAIRQDDIDDARPDSESDAVRERILRAFEVRLDETLRGEDDPEGLAREILSELEEDPEASDDNRPADLYSIWSAVTASTQEVKLQGRAFARLRESLDPLREFVPAVNAVREEVEGVAEVVGEAREQELIRATREVAGQIREEHLALLLDIRDRLKRGLDVSERQLQAARERARRGLFERLFGRFGKHGLEAVEALRTGVRLAFDRLEEAIRELDVTEIECLGRPFDPSCMRAVDVASEGEAREGGVEGAGSEERVLEVYRPGYERNGEILRLAEVKVTRSV